ncbi:MAG TPA: ClbS/DfsB family four-helix bundle protein [Anaerolineales bacterium]|nr:ClbS/DfsB family four-helix bundle protein [Anaerolineales bacterium]
MKEHILAALREQFESWEQLLANLSEEQLIAPQFDLGWSIKDVIAHLWAWQQISIARMEGGANDREPEYPRWIVDSIENWENDADGVNALTFERNSQKAWSDIYQNWKNGFLRFLELGHKISERELLDGDRFPWLNGYNLTFILIASYEHHQEHFEKLTDSLSQQ